jgi:ABC-type branched-subunit amino acid transport system substrate-binding protein
MKTLTHSLAFHFQVSAKQLNLTESIQRTLTFKPDGLIVYLAATEIEKLISELQNKELMMPVFIPWIPDIKSEVLSKNENLFFIEPFLQHANSGWNLFQKKYHRRFGANPLAVAAFTYDAIYLLVHAIEKSGLNRAAIRDAIANTDYLNPVSGKISWDNTGSNLIQPVLINMDDVCVALDGDIK